MSNKEGNSLVDEKLDSIIMLLKHVVVLQLAERDVPQQAIAKHVHLAKATVGKMLKGVKSDG